MNVFERALRNIQKSIRDYVVYFLTLIFGVAIFYVFNSIGDQTIIQKISESDSEMLQLMLSLLQGISIVVALILGFLIIYANHFLIRRRKREFGIYLLLGMGKKEVSKILICETLLVGGCSLAAGLGLGILSSQFLSILVGKFFEADMSTYVFAISVGAIAKTVVNFAVMYLIVLLFQSVTISKYNLIDLLYADKKTEKQVLKNPVMASLLFVLAAAILGVAYYRVGFCIEQVEKMELLTYILLGTAATLLLFWSLSGFLLNLLQKWKSLYYSNLNAFVIRQFCNSIHTSSVSMAVICLMLFVTICTFASGFSLAHQMQENIRKMTPVDFSILYSGKETVSKVLAKEGMNAENWADGNAVEIPLYNCKTVTYASGLGDFYKKAKEQFPYAKWDTCDTIMSLSDYNVLASMYGRTPLDIQEDEYAVVCDVAFLTELRNDNLANGGVEKMGSVTLKPAMPECVEAFICMSGLHSNTGVLVVPDEVIHNPDSKIEPAGYLMAGDFTASTKDEKKETERRLLKVTEKYTKWDYYSEDPIPPMVIGTKIMIRESNNGLTMMASFVVIYVGVVFLIASAALLALKALSESIDSRGRYMVLRKIGSDRKMLKRALFAQSGVYFMLPMLVAILHSIFGLRFLKYMMAAYVQKEMYWGICVAAVVMFVLYGGYMFATYKECKRLVELDE